jgi:hypothetical protein
MQIDTNKVVLEQSVSAPTGKNKKVGACPPKRHSNFFLTINTQKNINTMKAGEVDQLKNKFSQALDKLFHEKISGLIKLNGSKTGVKYGWKEDVTREELEKRVEHVKIDYTMEIGPESGKLHAHAVICFAKRACDTKLDYDGIRKFFNQELGFEIYFYSQVYNDASANIKNYIEKNPVQ